MIRFSPIAINLGYDATEFAATLPRKYVGIISSRSGRDGTFLRVNSLTLCDKVRSAILYLPEC